MRYILYPFMWVAALMFKCFYRWPTWSILAIVVLGLAMMLAEYAITGKIDSSSYRAGYNGFQYRSGKPHLVIP